MPYTATKKLKKKKFYSYRSGLKRKTLYEAPLKKHDASRQDRTIYPVEIPVIHLDAANAEPSTSSDHESKYNLHKAKRLDNWSALKDKLLSIGTELTYMAPHNICVSCHQTSDPVCRCVDCWPGALYCLACLQESHKNPHLHLFEAFKDGTFLFINLETPEWVRPDKHCCASSYLKEIVVMDEKGRQHKRRMKFCSCESPAETMMRSNLWPSSPKNPVMGFHTGLLEWMTALLLECHVSAKGFCEALRARLSVHHKGFVDCEINNVYKILMKECLVQYRYYQSRLRHPMHICKELGAGTQCPACFQNPTKVLSFDADFQLVRKMSSGINANSPKQEGKFFIDQSEVDEFMNSYTAVPTKEHDCSEFKAGNAIRSGSKNKKLDETAVFGSACRHEFPYMFFNLKHGERIGYSVFLLERIVEQNGSRNASIHILYDIACILEKHLKKNRRNDLLAAVKFAIPIFHCYGHKMACQILYSPRRTPGIGMSDGECMERLWSFLGKFANISKEMTPENRIDLLIDGLVHYGERVTHKQGKTLADKLLKAKQIKCTTSAILEETLTPLAGLTRDEVKQWSDEERDGCANIPLENKQTNQKDVALFEKVQKLMAERTFLLQMMKKYARGQAISIRLGRQLKNTNKSVKKAIAEYNGLEGSRGQLPGQLDFQNLQDINSEYTNSTMSSEVKRVLIDLVETLERCEEEILMLRNEMICVVDYYKMQHNAVILSLNICDNPTTTSVLLSEGLHIERTLLHLDSMFSHEIVMEDVSLYFHENVKLHTPSLETEVNTILQNLGDTEFLLQDDEHSDEYLDSDNDLSEDEHDLA